MIGEIHEKIEEKILLEKKILDKTVSKMTKNQSREYINQKLNRVKSDKNMKFHVMNLLEENHKLSELFKTLQTKYSRELIIQKEKNYTLKLDIERLEEKNRNLKNGELRSKMKIKFLEEQVVKGVKGGSVVGGKWRIVDRDKIMTYKTK